MSSFGTSTTRRDLMDRGYWAGVAQVVRVHILPNTWSPVWTPPMLSSVQCKHSRGYEKWIWGIHSKQATKHVSKGSLLVLKPNHKYKIGVSVVPQEGLMSSKIEKNMDRGYRTLILGKCCILKVAKKPWHKAKKLTIDLNLKTKLNKFLITTYNGIMTMTWHDNQEVI